MNEAFLHYLWKFRLFNTLDLKTTQGESLQILHPGEHNSNAGPDFFNARIRCGDTLLAGNVEVHLRSSDWKRHFHQHDKTYQNIVLHVVYEDDDPTISNQDEVFLTLELRHRISRRVEERYEDLQQMHPFVPCKSHWANVDEITKSTWLQRMLIERLETKCEAIQELLSQLEQNWEEAFYIMLARNFGFKINAVPFELLARHIPLQILAKNRANILQIEAMLFGVAGFLNETLSTEKYHADLRKEYQYQKQKHNFKEIDVTLWKFLRLRPANFPQVRLAQFANLIYRSAPVFGKVLNCRSAVEIKQLFVCSATLYWDTHYTFREPSTKRKKQMGEDAADNIIINTVAPFLFFYGKTRMQPSLQELAFDLLEQLPAENNAIVRNWETIGTKVKNAAQSQALLHLKKQYCDQRSCLQCSVGLKILKNI